MAVIIEQRNDRVTDFSDGAAGWRRHGNITLSHDTSRATFARLATGSSAAFVHPFPASNGAGFVETTVTDGFLLCADLAVDLDADSRTNEYVGLALRSDNFAQWVFIDTNSSLVRSLREDGAGNVSVIEGTALPTSASLRWEVELHWTGSLVAGRIRPYESRDDLAAWTALTITSTSSLATAPEWAGIGMAGTTNIHAPELYVYSLRLVEPEQPARHWYAVADVPGNRAGIELLLNRKSRASAAAHWTRDDHALAGSPKTAVGSTPLRSLAAEFSRNELVRYRTALESVTGLELVYAWFGVPRCAVSDELLHTELRPQVVTATGVSGVFGTRAMSFTATADHSFAAFDHDIVEIPDAESWLAMFVVSPTIVPVANVPLAGKQDLFQVAPTPRNGWQVWLHNAGNVLFDLSDTAGGTNTITVAKTYSAGTFFAICARVNRTTGLAQIAHDTASSATASVAGLSYLCPLRPFRIGDSRINRSETAPNARLHLAAFATGTQVEALNLQTLAANLLAAAT